MTTREYQGRRVRRKRRTLRMGPVLTTIILVLASIMFFAAGYNTGVAAKADTPVTVEPSTIAASVPVEPTAEVAPVTEEPVLYRDDIVSDGNLLSYELQETMQACCDEYEVPYALALAIAEVETHFDPDAVSSTGDYGLMQINQCNHEWLLEIGLDPMTAAGNIEAGIYIISQHLQAYGEPELALMAYNCGPGGAKKLWATGTYQTDYSRKVMTAFDHWTSVLEG